MMNQFATKYRCPTCFSTPDLAAHGPRRRTRPVASRALSNEDHQSHVAGGSWTNSVSWLRGYDQVLIPMEKASALFHNRVLARQVPTNDPRYRNAPFCLLTAETSCYRYRGQGIWTKYGVEASRRDFQSRSHIRLTDRLVS
jgi:hypothetical protein